MTLIDAFNSTFQIAFSREIRFGHVPDFRFLLHRNRYSTVVHADLGHLIIILTLAIIMRSFLMFMPNINEIWQHTFYYLFLIYLYMYVYITLT